MAFRFASLGSGSRGNATLIEAGETRILVDCGFAAREFEARCSLIGIEPTSLDAILVTHEHGDHVRGVGAVSRRFDLPVWMSRGTYQATDFGRIDQLHLCAGHASAFVLGELMIEPVPVPHDAREPTQFVFGHRGGRFGLLTDLGSITPRIVAAYEGVDALLLECNHDTQMLLNGPYPPSLQARVGGLYGHLANDQAADLLSRIDHGRLRHLVAGHLSEKNNAPELASTALVGVSEGLSEQLSLLIQDRASDWFVIQS